MFVCCLKKGNFKLDFKIYSNCFITMIVHWYWKALLDSFYLYNLEAHGSNSREYIMLIFQMGKFHIILVSQSSHFISENTDWLFFLSNPKLSVLQIIRYGYKKNFRFVNDWNMNLTTVEIFIENDLYSKWNNMKYKGILDINVSFYHSIIL